MARPYLIDIGRYTSTDASNSSLNNKSLSSLVSSITLDSGLEKSFSQSSAGKGQKLKRVSDTSENGENGAREYFNSLGLNSSHRFRTSQGPTAETMMCNLPKRKKSARDLNYEMSAASGLNVASAASGLTIIDCFSVSDEISEGDCLHHGEYDDFEEDSLSAENSASILRANSVCSLDLGDIFEEGPSQDISPKQAQRRMSSDTLSLHTPDDIHATSTPEAPPIPPVDKSPRYARQKPSGNLSMMCNPERSESLPSKSAGLGRGLFRRPRAGKSKKDWLRFRLIPSSRSRKETN